MGFFGKSRVKGITEYELKHKHVLAHLDSVFPHNLSSSKTKRAALHAVLGLASDRDTNMGHAQKGGIIQKDEFYAAIDGLEKGGVISTSEAQQLKSVAEKPLND
jgi:hypothetical protein